MDKKEKLCKQFVTRLVSNYGYSENQIGCDEVINETLTADVAVWKNADAKRQHSIPEICIVAIGKEEHIHINDDDYISNFDAAVVSSLTFFVAINLKECRVFYVNNTVRPFKKVEIGDFPKASDISTNAALKKFIARIKDNSKERILTKLSKSHNIIRNIDKLSPEAAFDEMSKILFIKMTFERESSEELIFTAKRFEEDEKRNKSNGEYYQYLFTQIKKKYAEDRLFDDNDKFRIRKETFVKIITELQDVNLGMTDDDVKGVVFENFLGKTFRGELGQFFTPRTIVDYIVRTLDIQEGETVCDPCCGSGGFLIKAFEYVQNEIDKSLSDTLGQSDIKTDAISTLKMEVDKSRKGSRYYKLCHDYFWGTDANPRMARTAKMNMVMHGDGHVGVYHHDGLYNVGGVYDGRFDVVLINPPFGAHLDDDVRITETDIPSDTEVMTNTDLFGTSYVEKVQKLIKDAANYVGKNNTKGMPIANMYTLNVSNTEALFVERTLRLLKPGGRAGIVLPEGVLTNKSMESVRKIILDQAQIVNITSIPSDVFIASGANVKPCILFLRKYKDDEIAKVEEISVTKVHDAGILSTGSPSCNIELPIASEEIRQFIRNGHISDSRFTKVVSLNQIKKNWNVDMFFHKSVGYNSDIPTCFVKDVLIVAGIPTDIEDDVLYKRVKVRLFNKGVELRDEKKGEDIGTKRQTIVSTGQFVVSRIDGKSGAFGIIPPSLDGAIVTHDFMVFDVDKEKVIPEYIELMMSNSQFLSQFRDASSGSTGRKRLSLDSFLNTEIPLPSLDKQHEMLKDIVHLRKRQEEISLEIEKNKLRFFSEIFTNN